MATITHTKVDTVTDWTQAQLDTIIAGGAAPLPPAGTLLANVVLPSDWNANHTVSNIVNADISASAAIAMSKITGTKAQFDTACSDGNFLYVGDVVGLTDGDKGDITVSSSGAVWTIDNSAVTLAKQADMATASVVYRKTAGSGAPEVNTLATLKTDLALTASDVGLGNVTNDAQTKAAIVPNTAPSAGQILVGNAGGTAYAPVSASGAFTLASTGAATIATPGTLTVSSSNSTATAHTHAITSSSAPGAAASLLATDSSGTIGSTGTRIVKGWFTDITCTNSIAASVTGSAATLTTGRTIGGVTFDGSANIVPQTIQSINEATDTTCFPLFISASGTQSLQPLNNTALTFNSNTGALGATSFSGAGTGLTGTAASLTAGNANGSGSWSFSYRNSLINGDMSLSRRATSFTGIVGTVVQTLDSWCALSAAGASMSVSQQSGIALNGFNYAMRWGRPNANTNTSVNYVYQIIKTADVYPLQGQSCILSFYARAGANFSAASSQITVNVQSGTGVDQGSASFAASTWTGQGSIISTAQAITTTLTRYSFTVAVGATHKELGILFYFTPVGTAGAADYVEITGVQLEVGVATPYEFLPDSVNLSRACEFLQMSFPRGTAPAQSAGVGGAITVKNPIALGDPSEYVQFIPPMFKTPTITTYNPSAANANWRDITAAADSTVSVDPGTTIGTSGVLIATSGTVTTLGDILAIHYKADAAI